MLAIVYAFKEWRQYLEAPTKSTIVLTDHETLQSFMTTKELNRRQVRWAEKLAAYDFIIVYRPGKENPADGLSRRPDHMVKDSPRENILADLLRVRLVDASEARADHTLEPGSIMLGMLTRGMARRPRDPQESDLATLAPAYRDADSDAIEHALRSRRDRVSSSGDETEDEAEMEEGILNDDLTEIDDSTSQPTPIGRIPSALTALFLDLQSRDEWCQGKQWEQSPSGKVKKKPFKGR
jgi:RNase H-like domain found in reverse transcriptase